MVEFYDMFSYSSKVSNSKNSIHNSSEKKANFKLSTDLRCLPPTFFEDLLDLEFSLKRNFKSEVLEEIINMYSVRKINFYRLQQNTLNLWMIQDLEDINKDLTIY